MLLMLILNNQTAMLLRQAILVLSVPSFGAAANNICIKRAAFVVSRPRSAVVPATRMFSTTGDANANNNDDATMLTMAADVTETIRSQSHGQMAKLISASADDGCPMVSQLLTSTEDVAQYLESNVDAILFDCDGVLYRGTDPIPNAAQALSSLVLAGKQIFFCTNNAGSNREQLRDKLASLLGMEDGQLTREKMVTSSYSAARYLQRELLGGTGGTGTKRSSDGDKNSASTARIPRVHVIGTEGLKSEISSAGFQVQGGQTDPYEPSNTRCGMSREELGAYPFPPAATEDDDGKYRIDAFVVGLDNEFNYRKLCIANVLMQRNPNALFVSTNEDAFDLVGVDARHLPGNGALVKALEHCSQRKAVCVGKPSPLLAELIAKEHNLDPSRTLFVGDRLDTDVRFGVESGMQSALVLTGCTTSEKIVAMCKETKGKGTEEEPMPTIIFPHMGQMMMEGGR